MAGLKSLFIALLITGIFGIAIVTFGINLAIDNGATQTIANQANVSSLASNLNTSLSNYQSQAQNASSDFANDTGSQSALGLVFFSVGHIWNEMVDVPQMMYQTTLGFIKDTIFSDPAFATIFTTITAAIVILALLYAWRWIRSGLDD